MAVAEIPLELETPSQKMLSSSSRSDIAGASTARRGAAAWMPLALAVMCAILILGGLIRIRHEQSVCTGGWPMFRTRSELEAHGPWAAYVLGVYGSLPSHSAAYPLCIGDLWQLSTHGLEASGVIPPEVASRCPRAYGTVAGAHYELHTRLSPPNLTWIWHPAPNGFLPLDNKSWVEVLHKGGIEDERVGAWFLQAKGSGIWINLDRTLAFADHDDAWQHFGVMGLPRAGRNEAMCRNASMAGWDTLQFTQHTCGMMYGDCLNTSLPSLTYFNRELVSTHLIGIHPCASEAGNSSLLRTGWPMVAGGGAPCTCNNSAREHLHCAEVPFSLLG